MNLALPNELQLDVLREVANIGCGHAADALSRLVGGRRVSIDVPVAVAAAEADLSGMLGGGDRILAVALEVQGDVRGRMLLAWTEADAQQLAGLLVRRSPAESLLDEPFRSALAEVANIIGSACLSGIARFTRLRVLPSTPSILFDSAKTVVEALREEGELGAAAVVLQARFITAHVPPLTGQLLIVPDVASLPRLFGALGL